MDQPTKAISSRDPQAAPTQPARRFEWRRLPQGAVRVVQVVMVDVLGQHCSQLPAAEN